MVFLQAYSIRLKQKICGYYYPEMERERILYLHRRIRHKRKAFKMRLKEMNASMKKEQRVNEELAASSKVVKILPFTKRFFKGELKNCLNCGSNEDEALKFLSCPICGADYCETCYEDLKQVCALCENRDKDTETEMNKEFGGANEVQFTQEEKNVFRPNMYTTDNEEGSVYPAK